MGETPYSYSRWKLWSNIRVWEGDAFSISDELRNKMRSYEVNVNFQAKHILLPEELKDLSREADVFLSLLLRWLDRYIGYLVEAGDKRTFAIPPFLVKYSNHGEIDALPFPSARLVPREPDTYKYYARLSRAFLHLFSYPGMTTCRCETEPERNTGILLYSFFDWFATLSYTPSAYERFSSIQIFNRNSSPQWTTEGFAPIAFLSLPLKSVNLEMRFGELLQEGYFNNREIPDFLLPLLISVQPGLNTLLVREIENWKKDRKTKEERFIMPDWLFIHGIVYDPIEIQLYTCTPRVTECDTDGVPSKWEFACLPVHAFYLRIYECHSIPRRLTGAIALLQIRDHTTRISQALEGLNLDSNECGLAALCKSAADEEESREKGILDVFSVETELDLENDERRDEAMECLINCIDRTGLHSSLDESGLSSIHHWMCFDSPGKVLRCDTRYFLKEFLENWRPTSELFSLPEDWLKPTPIEIPEIFVHTPAWAFFHTEPKLQLQISISPHEACFVTLSEEEVLSRHSDPDSFAPDFLLAVPARKDRENYAPKLTLGDLSPSALHSLEHFQDVVQYMCHEIDAKAAISSLFKCIPGCWLRYDTESRFPSPLATTPSQIDFSLLLHPIQTVPIQMETLTPDVMLRCTVLNPALMIGIQGPTAWPDEFACPPSTAQPRPKNKTEALRQLAKAIEPSLKVHLMNWQLRFEQGLTLSRELPPWFMLFGIIYDAQEVNIVAHIPAIDDASRYSFISCIVDTISFPLAMPSSNVSETWYLDRFRVAFSLLSLQKHAFRMAGLWECVAWPDDIVSWEEYVEREYLGPVLTPSERGYMVEPHPMAELYQEIHGSDESIDEDEDDENEEAGDENDELDEDEDEEDITGSAGDGQENRYESEATKYMEHDTRNAKENGCIIYQKCDNESASDICLEVTKDISVENGPRTDRHSSSEVQEAYTRREERISSRSSSLSPPGALMCSWRKHVELWRGGVTVLSPSHR